MTTTIEHLMRTTEREAEMLALSHFEVGSTASRDEQVYSLITLMARPGSRDALLVVLCTDFDEVAPVITETVEHLMDVVHPGALSRDEYLNILALYAVLCWGYGENKDALEIVAMAGAPDHPLLSLVDVAITKGVLFDAWSASVAGLTVSDCLDFRR